MPYAICHSERSEESYSGVKILHCVQDDKILSTPDIVTNIVEQASVPVRL